MLWQPTDRLTIRARAWQFQTNQDYLQVMNSLDPPYASNQGKRQRLRSPQEQLFLQHHHLQVRQRHPDKRHLVPGVAAGRVRSRVGTWATARYRHAGEWRPCSQRGQ